MRKDELGDSETSEDIFPDDTESPQSNRWEGSLKELLEALEDESHPRHAQAVKENERLAARMMPSLEALKKTVGVQIQGLEALKEVTAPFAKVSERITSQIKVLDFMEQTRAIVEQASGRQHTFENLSETLTQRQRVETERAEREAETASKQLEVTTAMAAGIQQLTQQMKEMTGSMGDVAANVKEGNESSHKASICTIVLAALTLAASIVSIVLTIWLR
ncbi:MAG: hypothetical protein E7I43_08695 [Actinomyces sp.]|nr:hypothetical protein [Actinomyces sp.]